MGVPRTDRDQFLDGVGIAAGLTMPGLDVDEAGPADMRFTVEWHPGVPCGSQDDGSFCYTQGDAHFSVPAPPPAETAAEGNWEGWQDVGYVTEDGLPVGL